MSHVDVMAGKYLLWGAFLSSPVTLLHAQLFIRILVSLVFLIIKEEDNSKEEGEVKEKKDIKDKYSVEKSSFYWEQK